MLEIDGSYLEGGGQILRNALSLSCILRRPIRVTNIRANRPKPGLSTQHLFGLNLLAEITGAQISGNVVESTTVEFQPGRIKSGNYVVETRTAASISLILQAALPVLIYGNAKSTLELVGGTNVGMAPQVDFMTEVLRPNLETFGVTFDFDLLRRGYYPRGGGRCRVTVPPVRVLQAVDLTQFGTLTEICGWCFVAGRLPPNLAQEMRTAALKKLQQKLGQNIRVPVNVESYKESADVARDNGSGVILKAVSSHGCTLGASTLGEKQVNAHSLGSDAASELARYVQQGVCVDCHVQDQLILFMALAEGVSRMRTCALTNHTRTAMHVAEQMTGVKFNVQEEANGEHVIISCQGIGYRNEYV